MYARIYQPIAVEDVIITWKGEIIAVRLFVVIDKFAFMSRRHQRLLLYFVIRRNIPRLTFSSGLSISALVILSTRSTRILYLQRR